MLKACKYIAKVISYFVPATSEKLKPVTEALHYSTALSMAKERAKLLTKFGNCPRGQMGILETNSAQSIQTSQLRSAFRTIAK